MALSGYFVAAVAVLASIVYGQRQYGFNHRDVVRDNDAVAKYYPDIGMELLSPAFLMPETVPETFHLGSTGPTDDLVLDSFIRSLARKNSWMTYKHFHFTTEEGRKIPYVRLSRPTSSYGREKVRVWVQGAVHGDEPGGDQAVLGFLGALAANRTLSAYLLERLDIMVLPRYNPDGVFYLQDTFATNLDPNRDHIKLASQHTRAIKRQFNKFAPHVAIDVHEYTATRQYGRYHMGADSLFATGRNLNIHPNIRNISEAVFVPRITARLDKYDLTWGRYVTSTGSEDLSYQPTFTEAGSDAKIGRNGMGLSQCITFLSETRGIQLTDQHFQRRVSTGLLTILTIVQTARENADLVVKTVDGSIRSLVSGKETADIVVTDHANLIPSNVTLVDITDDTIAPRPVKYLSATPTTANLTRSRPEAYIIPAGWANLVDRLEVLGLEVDRLEAPWQGTVEALTINSTTFDTSYYEGAVRVYVTSEASTKDISLPPGSFFVSTRQKNAALAFVALEPESIDSFVTFNIIPINKGDEYPVYRVL
ncbi:hypothetical protein ACJ41O_006410 [Fusarium nematophilum]